MTRTVYSFTLVNTFEAEWQDRVLGWVCGKPLSFMLEKLSSLKQINDEVTMIYVDGGASHHIWEKYEEVRKAICNVNKDKQ